MKLALTLMAVEVETEVVAETDAAEGATNKWLLSGKLEEKQWT